VSYPFVFDKEIIAQTGGIMNNLTVFEQNGQLLTDSREVAMMVGKDHSKLLRDIKGYASHLIEANFGLNEYFIESEYKDSIGRTLPC
jgi:phage regulator Rha-like protein